MFLIQGRSSLFFLLNIALEALDERMEDIYYTFIVLASLGVWQGPELLWHQVFWVARTGLNHGTDELIVPLLLRLIINFTLMFLSRGSVGINQCKPSPEAVFWEVGMNLSELSG